ncbi:MAG: prolipoprotein diacylglyceryl transferase [Lachnospiraceae bacterium]|nr:prolipoprotein diacylglyceryl transferase [Lachnospiraceae bacterium]
MLPVFHINEEIEISTYWLMFAVGVVAMCALACGSRKRYGVKIWQAVIYTLLLAVCGLAGTKILYILENWQDFLKNGFTLGGLSFFGAVYLIPLLMWLPGRLFSLNYEQSMDLCAPCVALILACMRIGCFLNGCCGGREILVSGRTIQPPTQLIEMVWDLAIMLFLLYGKPAKRQGSRYPLFMLCYGTVRFLLEFLRDTEKDWLYLSHGQWFSIVAIIMGLIWLFHITGSEDEKEIAL